MKTIAITGATGLLGSALLYELLQTPRSDVGRIVVLGRAGGFPTLHARLRAQLFEHGLAYLGTPEADPDAVLDRVFALESSLEPDTTGLACDAVGILRAERIDTFIHVAGHTTFLRGRAAEEDCQRVNVDGLRNLLELLDDFDLGRLFHISSAYSSGHLEGRVTPDTLDLDGDFQNPYQQSKAVGERIVRDWASARGLPLVVFRPATIGGRLLRAPRGHVTKFDVYLGWARAMQRMGPMLGNFDGVRLAVHPTAGLNIVPVDFAARLLATAALREDLEHDSYHLANPTSTPHSQYVRQMLDLLGFEGAILVDQRPPEAEWTREERVYYRKIGWIFADYVEREELFFDPTSQSELEAKAGVTCPAVDAEAFEALLRYGYEREFTEE